MTPKEAAKKLGVSAKIFRSFLRRDPKYKSPGSGGAYDLSQFDFSDIEREFSQWRNAITPRTHRTAVETEELISPLSFDDTPLPLSALRKEGVSASDRARVRRISQARIDRLEAVLLARGLHISQMQDREGWKRCDPK